MNRLSKILIIPLLIVMVFAFGMNASAVIHSKWVAGDFIFYDATQDILTIKDDTDGLIVGESTAGVDFKVWSDTASTYLLWDADADDLILTGTATQLVVEGTTDAGDTSTGSIHTAGGVGIAKKLYVGLTANLAGAVTLGSTLTVAGATQLNSTLTVGLVAGTGHDVKFNADTASYYIHFDAEGDGNKGKWYFGRENGYGIDVKFMGQTAGNFIDWDASVEQLIFTDADLVFDAIGQIRWGPTPEYWMYYDGSALNILANADKVLQIGDVTNMVSPRIFGKLSIVPTEAGTFLNFLLETEWVSGTLINADVSALGVTIAADVIGMVLDFNANVTAVADHDVTGFKLLLPALDSSTSVTTTYIGFDLNTAGDIDQSTTGTFVWKGINIQMPTTDEATGTATATGVYITSGTITNGTQNVMYASGTFTYGIDFSASTCATADIRLQHSATITNTSSDLLTITEPTITLTASTAVNLDGPITTTKSFTISPVATGTFIDFVLETEWTQGTLINADFAGSTTFDGNIIGMLLDFSTSIAMVTDHDLTGYQVKLPDLTQSNTATTLIIGFDLPTADALEQSAGAGTITWKGVNIQLPEITQTAGTVTATGMLVTGATINAAGTLTGVSLVGNLSTGVAISGTVVTGISIAACTTANVVISGANVTGISLTGTYSAHGIAVGILGGALDLVAYDDRLVSIWASSDATGGNVMPLYVSMTTDGECKARAAEFVLTPTAQLGQWANAVKTYLDLTGASGGTGTVSSLCVELLLPDEQMTGNIAPLEIELVAPDSGFVALEGVHTGAAYFILAVGSGTKITEIDDHGYFLSLQGLTGASGGLVSENEQTLKCNIGTTVKYMMFSTTEGGYTVVPASGVTVVDVDLTAVWVSGTVLNVDFSAATTLSGSAVGLNLDFSAVHVDSDQAITAIDLTFPDLTFDAVTKAIVGVEISGDTLTQLNSGTGTWTGIDITIPTMVETGGTINAYGIKIVGGTLTTDPNTYGIDLTGTFHHAIKIGASGAGISYSLDGDINVAIYSTFTGDVAFFRGMYVKSDYAPATAGEASVYGIRGHANLADGQTHDAGALTDESFVGVHGYATSHSGGTFDAAGLTIAGIKGEVGGTGTYTAAKVVCGVWAKPALSSSVSAGHYTGVYVYASHGSYPADSMLYAWGYYESGIDFSGWASATKPAFVFRAGAGIVTSPNHTALSTEDGSIQIKVGGDTRYIKVYDDS